MKWWYAGRNALAQGRGTGIPMRSVKTEAHLGSSYQSTQFFGGDSQYFGLLHEVNSCLREDLQYSGLLSEVNGCLGEDSQYASLLHEASAFTGITRHQDHKCTISTWKAKCCLHPMNINNSYYSAWIILFFIIIIIFTLQYYGWSMNWVLREHTQNPVHWESRPGSLRDTDLLQREGYCIYGIKMMLFIFLSQQQNSRRQNYLLLSELTT